MISKILIILSIILLGSFLVYGIIWLINKYKTNVSFKNSGQNIRDNFEILDYNEPPQNIFGTTSEISNKNIHQLINNFSPIYIFHKDERYYPSPRDTDFQMMNLFFMPKGIPNNIWLITDVIKLNTAPTLNQLGNIGDNKYVILLKGGIPSDKSLVDYLFGLTFGLTQIIEPTIIEPSGSVYITVTYKNSNNLISSDSILSDITIDSNITLQKTLSPISLPISEYTVTNYITSFTFERYTGAPFKNLFTTGLNNKIISLKGSKQSDYNVYLSSVYTQNTDDKSIMSDLDNVLNLNVNSQTLLNYFSTTKSNITINSGRLSVKSDNKYYLWFVPKNKNAFTDTLVEDNVYTMQSYLAGDLNNPFFETPNITSYHLGMPGCPGNWSNNSNFSCDKLAEKVLSKNSAINWSFNPLLCSITHKKIFQNGHPIRSNPKPAQNIIISGDTSFLAIQMVEVFDQSNNRIIPDNITSNNTTIISSDMYKNINDDNIMLKIKSASIPATLTLTFNNIINISKIKIIMPKPFAENNVNNSRALNVRMNKDINTSYIIQLTTPNPTPTDIYDLIWNSDSNNSGSGVWVTDVIYESHFAFNGSISILPGLGTHTGDVDGVGVRFLTQDLIRYFNSNNITPDNAGPPNDYPMPIKIYLACHGGSAWYNPKDVMFRSLGVNCAYGRDTSWFTHPIIYMGRESHEQYISPDANTNRIYGTSNDQIGGGVCWQPPAVFLDIPQDLQTHNLRINSMKSDYYDTFISKPLPSIYNNIGTFITDFVNKWNTFNIGPYTYNENENNYIPKHVPLFSDYSPSGYGNFFGFGPPWVYYPGNRPNYIFQVAKIRLIEGNCSGDPDDSTQTKCIFSSAETAGPGTFVPSNAARPINDNEVWNNDMKWYEPSPVICNRYPDPICWTAEEDCCGNPGKTSEYQILKREYVYAITDIQITNNYTSFTNIKDGNWSVVCSNIGTIPLKNIQGTPQDFQQGIGGSDIFLVVKYENVDTSSSKPVLTELVTNDCKYMVLDKNDKVSGYDSKLVGHGLPYLKDGHYYSKNCPKTCIGKVMTPINETATFIASLSVISNRGGQVDTTKSVAYTDADGTNVTIKLDKNVSKKDMHGGCGDKNYFYLLCGFGTISYPPLNCPDLNTFMNKYDGNDHNYCTTTCTNYCRDVAGSANIAAYCANECTELLKGVHDVETFDRLDTYLIPHKNLTYRSKQLKESFTVIPFLWYPLNSIFESLSDPVLNYGNGGFSLNGMQQQLLNKQLIFNSLPMLEMNGSQQITIPNINFSSNGISISFMFMLNEFGISTNARPFITFRNYSTNDLFAIAIMKTSSTYNIILNLIKSGQQNGNNYISIDLNKLYHIVWTIDSSGTWILYINGKNVWNSPNQGYPASNYTNNYIGTMNNPMKAYIRDFRIYNNTLSITDITDIYKTCYVEYPLYWFKFNGNLDNSGVGILNNKLTGNNTYYTINNLNTIEIYNKLTLPDLTLSSNCTITFDCVITNTPSTVCYIFNFSILSLSLIPEIMIPIELNNSNWTANKGSKIVSDNGNTGYPMVKNNILYFSYIRNTITSSKINLPGVSASEYTLSFDLQEYYGGGYLEIIASFYGIGGNKISDLIFSDNQPKNSQKYFQKTTITQKTNVNMSLAKYCIVQITGQDALYWKGLFGPIISNIYITSSSIVYVNNQPIQNFKVELNTFYNIVISQDSNKNTILYIDGEQAWTNQLNNFISLKTLPKYFGDNPTNKGVYISDLRFYDKVLDVEDINNIISPPIISPYDTTMITSAPIPNYVSYIFGYLGLLKSTDGEKTWKIFSTSNPLTNINSIVYNNSYFLECGTGSNNNITVAKSIDGTTWTSSNPFGSGGVANNIKWNGNYWLAGGYNSNKTLCILNSLDGENWGENNIAISKPVSIQNTQTQNLGTGLVGTCNCIAIDSFGNLYAGGNFKTTGDNITVNNIAKWNGTSWSALGNGLNGECKSLVIDSFGNVYAGGSFTMAINNVNNKPLNLTVNNIAKWNISISTWTTLGYGLNGTCNALALDSSGNLYAGGVFITVTNIVNNKPQNSTVNNIAKWNISSSTWSALGYGIVRTSMSSCNSLVTDSFNNLYVGGVFTAVTNIINNNPQNLIVNNIAKWNGTSWSALGSGLTGTCNTLVTDSLNNLYIGGSFTTVTNIVNNKSQNLTVNNIAKWNGTSWSALGSGLIGECKTLLKDLFDNVYILENNRTTSNIKKFISNISILSKLSSDLNGSYNTFTLDSMYNFYLGGGGNLNNITKLNIIISMNTPTPNIQLNKQPFSECKGFEIIDNYWISFGIISNKKYKIATSYNGINWTLSNPEYSLIKKIVWNDNYFLMLGRWNNIANPNSISTITFSNTNPIDPSTLAWNTVLIDPFIGGQANDAAWNGSYWVCVGNNLDSSVCIAKSYDGFIWTVSNNNPFYRGQGSGITWNGLYWISTGNNYNSTVNIIKSLDGLTWDILPNPTNNIYPSAINGILTIGTYVPQITTPLPRIPVIEPKITNTTQRQNALDAYFGIPNTFKKFKSGTQGSDNPTVGSIPLVYKGDGTLVTPNIRTGDRIGWGDGAICGEMGAGFSIPTNPNYLCVNGKQVFNDNLKDKYVDFKNSSFGRKLLDDLNKNLPMKINGYIPKQYSYDPATGNVNIILDPQDIGADKLFISEDPEKSIKITIDEPIIINIFNDENATNPFGVSISADTSCKDIIHIIVNPKKITVHAVISLKILAPVYYYTIDLTLDNINLDIKAQIKLPIADDSSTGYIPDVSIMLPQNYDSTFFNQNGNPVPNTVYTKYYADINNTAPVCNNNRSIPKQVNQPFQTYKSQNDLGYNTLTNNLAFANQPQSYITSSEVLNKFAFLVIDDIPELLIDRLSKSFSFKSTLLDGLGNPSMMALGLILDLVIALLYTVVGIAMISTVSTNTVAFVIASAFEAILTLIAGLEIIDFISGGTTICAIFKRVIDDIVIKQKLLGVLKEKLKDTESITKILKLLITPDYLINYPPITGL